MGTNLDIRVRSLDGSIVQLTVPQNATVLVVKQEFCRKVPSCPHYQQKLLIDNPREELVDDRVLSSYPSLKSGSTINLLRIPPWELHVTDMYGKQHTVAVPSIKPKDYSICDLRSLLESTIGQTLDGYRIIFDGKECVEMRDGRRTTLGDYNIDKEDTIIVGKMTSKNISPSVDLCFMVDCTGSMGSWIEGVKNNVKLLRDKLAAQFLSCDLRFAFVRYTDYDLPECTRTTKLDFTKDQTSFHQFVSGIVADGGGDGPEDIMGALKVTLSTLSWRPGVDKVLIHIADSPCHGTQYHDGGGDTYPNGDPAGISHDKMMQLVVNNNVHYWFGYIQKQYTDKMISVFNESLQRLSDNRLTIRQVDATNTEQLADTFFKSVKGTIFASEAARRATIRRYVIDPSVPVWASLPQLRCIKTASVSMPGISALQRGFIVPEPSIPLSVQCAPNPFEEGEECVAYHGLDATASQKRIVLKRFKRDGAEYNSLDCYNKVLLIHAISTAYASEFNGEKAKPMGASTLTFVPTELVQCNQSGQVVYYIYQPFLDGNFEKFNGNSGLVFTQSQWSEPIQAFSHYTYARSGKTLMVCDLQGVVSGSCVSLSDPAIHSRTEDGNNFGPTDLGFSGIEQFMKTHRCGETCRKLGL